MALIKFVLMCIPLTCFALVPLAAKTAQGAAETKDTTAAAPGSQPPSPPPPNVPKARGKVAHNDERGDVVEVPTVKEEVAKLIAEEEERKKQLELAEKQRAADEAKQPLSTRILRSSRLYTGLGGGLGIGINKVHGVGYTFGMTIDYMTLGKYGFHFAAESGSYPARSGTLSAGGTSVAIDRSPDFSLLSFSFAAVYALPQLWHFDTAVGLGIALYQIKGGSFDFNQAAAPLLYSSLYYNVLSHLQVGLLTQLVFPFASKLQSTGTETTLDATVLMTALTFQLSVRYSWF